ncbi:MAG: SAM-dependent methyltransferase [Flavobacteriaceae bacterium]|nr:SAM-dependent methyltransferase [Flavobacteriaceae bacterium]
MKSKTIKAIDAIQEAQKIAFSPFLFQSVVSLRKLGVFDFIFEKRNEGGVTIDEISKELSISTYGLSVLLEIAESSDVVDKDEDNRYELTKIGYFLNYNETTNVNINFTNEVCYKGLFYLNDSIKNGKPEGLKEFGNWSTIYEGLSSLDPEIKKAWFEFDHHYSDFAFEEALEILFEKPPKTIYDIGGNTGKFAISCCKKDKNVKVKIHDLPGQLNIAMANAKENGFADRISGYEMDWLSEDPKITTGANIIWMSQFLDCFSKDEILKILTVCANSMDEKTELYIMETFTDRQRFDNAKFSLEATSLYFTVMANGNSKMYKASEFMELIEKAGLHITKEIRKVGENHTILICKK